MSVRCPRTLAVHPCRQQGQAMVLGLLLVALGALVVVRYFGVGQMVSARAQQTHALDAAAYSGALVQARALNLASFINRAHVGHQVAMAHLVTLGSWALFGGAEANRLIQGNPPAYLIAMMFGSDHGAAYGSAALAAGSRRHAEVWGQLFRHYADHDRVVHDTLHRVQHRMLVGLADTRLAAINRILTASYPDKQYSLSMVEDHLTGFLVAYRGTSLSGFIAQVTSQFHFLDPRNHTSRNGWMVNPRCPHLRHELRRRGETRLSADGVWESSDTQSYHALRSNKWIGCYYREYAMGWGWIAGLASPSQDLPYAVKAPENFGQQDFWRWVHEVTDWDLLSGAANPLANSYAFAGRPVWPGRGLPAYYDISEQGRARPLRFGVRLRRKAVSGEVIETRSKAETYFQRPDARIDQRREYPNLFNPYWQARLAASWRDGFQIPGLP